MDISVINQSPLIFTCVSIFQKYQTVCEDSITEKIFPFSKDFFSIQGPRTYFFQSIFQTL